MMKPYSHPEDSQQYINVGKKDRMKHWSSSSYSIQVPDEDWRRVIPIKMSTLNCR